MEDIDPPREQPGASHSILASLRAHGLNSDEPVFWQSERVDAYRETAQKLLQDGLAFRCDCSRQRLTELGGVYDGHCRHRELSAEQPHAIRLRLPEYSLSGTDTVTVHDRIQQPLNLNLKSQIGDFVIWRKDDLPAYQLAVVLDDAVQDISDVLRGSDLYESTSRQICLQQQLRLSTPRYAHIPVLNNLLGQKLSKQSHAPAIDDSLALDNLRLALKFLNQPENKQLRIDRFLEQAIEQWQLQVIDGCRDISEAVLA